MGSVLAVLILALEVMQQVEILAFAIQQKK